MGDVPEGPQDLDQLIHHLVAGDGHPSGEHNDLTEVTLEEAIPGTGTLVVGDSGEINSVEVDTNVKEECVDSDVDGRGESIRNDDPASRSISADTLSDSPGVRLFGVQLKLFRIVSHCFKQSLVESQPGPSTLWRGYRTDMQ